MKSKKFCLGLPQVISDRKNSRQPRVVLDMNVKLQLLSFCITYIIVYFIISVIK